MVVTSKSATAGQSIVEPPFPHPISGTSPALHPGEPTGEIDGGL